jgi:glycosyltransferase involved in cell wall biosynthesis
MNEPTPKLRVTFVIPVRDDGEKLRRCLSSIRANRYEGPVEIVVVDNGSQDDSTAVAREAGATVLVRPAATVAALRNSGATRGQGDVLAFVDADHVIDNSWLEAAVQMMVDPTVGAVGAPYLPPPEVNWVQRAYDRFRSHRRGIRDVEWLESGNLAVRRRLFWDLGGFDTTLETCEDVDLCNRLRAQGYRIFCDERMRSVHYGDPSTLRALFFGELWRGRDNVRATLRGPVTIRSLPSVVIPIVNIIFLTAVVVGTTVVPWLGARLVLAGGCGFLLLASLRAVRMTLRAERPVLWELAPNMAVACIYDLARALALVSGATHRRRRETAAAS